MDNTRHERAALVVVAYLIGIVTTYIWVGFDNVAPTNFSDVSSDGSASIQTASAISSQSKLENENLTEKQAPETALVSYTNGLLEVQNFDGSRLLSYNPETSSIAAMPDFMNQGIHYGEIVYKISPNNDFIFFCEAKTQGSDSCLPYVYDFLRDTIEPVRRNGGATELTTNMAAEAKWNDSGLLVLGIMTSQNSSSPWLLNY